MRSRIAKVFGASTSTAVTPLQAATELAGMDGSRPFGPGVPMRPADGLSRPPRSHDYQTGANVVSRPRLGEQVAFSALRGLVDAYDIAQMCIWHRIDSIRGVDHMFVAKPGETGDVSGAIALAERVLAYPDRETPFSSWMAKFLYDVLAFDAGVLYRMRNVAGRAIGLRVVDGTTIAPLLDYWGNRPKDEAPAFVQFAQGLPWEWLLDRDVVYRPFRPRSNSPYGKAPLESVLLNANTDLRFQAYFLGRFTEGNVPEGFAAAPEGWSPDQIAQFQDAWDALLYGDDTAKHQIRWVPHGTTFAWTNEKAFEDTFSLFMMRKTAAAYHVPPHDLGFTETSNRSVGESQQEAGARVGDAPLMAHLQDILSAFVQDDLGLPLIWKFDQGEEQEDRLQTAQADQIYVNIGAISTSKVAELRYGISEPAGQPVPRYIMTARSGPVPLSALLAVAGPVDPDSGAPLAGGVLPHKPFAPIEGVTPQKPPSEPPLAVQVYPADNVSSVQAAAVSAAAPVVKAETVGITEATGAYGSPLLDDDDDAPDDEQTAVVKAAELVTFRKFAKARRREGRWRDFTFHALDASSAREANRAGRVAVLKAAGTASVAGLAVVADGTGRVLMLQRALDPADPAGGCWELPGGHAEPGESLVAAAVREWQEETGLLLSVDTIAGLVGAEPAWVSPNGIYVGYVAHVPGEASLDLHGGRGSMNPDDPDGDAVEAIAWTDPAHLAGNPAVRPELLADLDLVLPELGVVDADDDAVVKAGGAGPKAWSAHPVRVVEQRLTDWHAPKVQAGFSHLVASSELRAAVSAYLERGSS